MKIIAYMNSLEIYELMGIIKERLMNYRKFHLNCDEQEIFKDVYYSFYGDYSLPETVNQVRAYCLYTYNLYELYTCYLKTDLSHRQGYFAQLLEYVYDHLKIWTKERILYDEHQRILKKFMESI